MTEVNAKAIHLIWSTFEDNNGYVLKYGCCYCLTYFVFILNFEICNIVLENNFRMYVPEVFFLMHGTDMSGKNNHNPMDFFSKKRKMFV